MSDKPVSNPRDTAPQPPPDNPPSRYKGRCDVHGLRVCDECQYGETDAKLLAAAEARIAALEAQIAEAQERLSMVVEALEQWAPPEFRICYRCKGVGTVATDTRGRPIPLAPCNYCDGSGINTNPRLLKTCAALSATAEAVAQHTAEVEARAIQKCQRCVTPQQLAEIMHETYERQALIEGWTTQESCRVPFAELPEANRRVMLQVACAVLWATPDLSGFTARLKREGAAEELVALAERDDWGEVLIPRGSMTTRQRIAAMRNLFLARAAELDPGAQEEQDAC